MKGSMDSPKLTALARIRCLARNIFDTANAKHFKVIEGLALKVFSS